MSLVLFHVKSNDNDAERPVFDNYLLIWHNTIYPFIGLGKSDTKVTKIYSGF